MVCKIFRAFSVFRTHSADRHTAFIGPHRLEVTQRCYGEVRSYIFISKFIFFLLIEDIFPFLFLLFLPDKFSNLLEILIT